MIELLSVTAQNGSLLHLGAMMDEDAQAPETNVPKDVPLGFWHDESPAFDRWNPRVSAGRISSVWPVMIAGSSYYVVAGEVKEDDVESVLLRFSRPEQPPYAQELAELTDVLGRRVWMAHFQFMRGRRWVVSATWLPTRTSESILIDPIPDEQDPST